jgi:hypothetical protein
MPIILNSYSFGAKDARQVLVKLITSVLMNGSQSLLRGPQVVRESQY